MKAQTPQYFPQVAGESIRYNAVIEMPKGYLSGICIILREEDAVKGCFFNEFGISAIDFTYDMRKDKVKLHNVIAMLNKWYIKRVLKNDVRLLMHELQSGNGTYRDERYQLQFQFTLLSPEAPEE